MGSETSYKTKIRRVVGGWSEAYEPGRGSGVGYPDLQFLDDERLVPVEVKRGRMDGGMLFSERIRPAQIAWHHKFQKAGGISFVFVCFNHGRDFYVWAAPRPFREVTSKWKQGWPKERCTLVIKNKQLVNTLAWLVLSES